MADDSNIIDHVEPEPQGSGFRSALKFVLLAGCIALVASAIAVMARRRMYSGMNKDDCQNNLRMIGVAVQVYWQDHHQYPGDLQTVFQTGMLNPPTFTCPSSSDVLPADSVIGARGTCSYVYVGGSFGKEAQVDSVIALEDPANHDLDGGNVLYGDGHVEWVTLQNVVQIMNDLQQGMNPPSSNTSLTAKQAAKIYEAKWKALMPQMKSGVWRIPAAIPTMQAAQNP